MRKYVNTFLIGIVLALASLSAAQQIPPAAPELKTSRLGFPVFGLNAVPITGATLQVVGNPGQATWWIWGVANYQEGSVMSLLGVVTNAPNTLSGSNFIAIYPFYPAPAGVTVDILATSSALQPSGACACAVATGQTTGVINFQSNTTSAYTVSLLNPPAFSLYLTNEVVGTGSSHLLLRKADGTLVNDLSVAGGGSGCLLQSSVASGVVFLDSSVRCTSSSQLTFSPQSGISTSTILVTDPSTWGVIQNFSANSLVTSIQVGVPALNDLSVVPGAGTIQITPGSSNGLSIGAGNAAVVDQTAIAAISRTANVVTATCNFCSYPVGAVINVNGVTDSSYNGNFTVTGASCCSTGNTTLTWAQVGANSSSNSGHVALAMNHYNYISDNGPLNTSLYGFAAIGNTNTDQAGNPSGMLFMVVGSQATQAGGPISLYAGNSGSSTGGAGGNINLFAGNGIGAGNDSGGSINLTAGTPSHAGTAGLINLNGSVLLSTISPGTSPICANGSGGVLTTSGCNSDLANARDFSVGGCTPASSTDSQCTGTITLPVAYADGGYIPIMTVNNNGTAQNAALLATVNGALSAGSFPYTLTCTFYCSPVNAPTIYVHTFHP